MNACHTSASKCEEDFKKLSEQKSAQDLYLEKLNQDMEDLEQKCLDYDAQVNWTDCATFNLNVSAKGKVLPTISKNIKVFLLTLIHLVFVV